MVLLSLRYFSPHSSNNQKQSQLRGWVA